MSKANNPDFFVIDGDLIPALNVRCVLYRRNGFFSHSVTIHYWSGASITHTCSTKREAMWYRSEVLADLNIRT